MFGNMKKFLADQLQVIRDAGLYKGERIITSPQQGGSPSWTAKAY